MAQNFFQTGWEDLLPDVYSWIDGVKIEVTSDLPAQGLVAVLMNHDAKAQTFEVNALGMKKEVADKILETIKITGWKGNGTHLLTIDQRPYLLVAAVKLNVTAPQKNRAFGIEVAKASSALKFTDLTLCKPKDSCSLEVLNGYAMGAYATKGFKTPKDKNSTTPLPQKITLLGSDATAQEITDAKHMIKSTAFTRHLQDSPPNYLDSVRFGELAQEISKKFGFKCNVYGKEKLQELGMGSFLSVNTGSAIDPRLIVCEIPGKNTSKTIAYCGKGLTFDSGGISIKPSGGMEEMKYDMSGGAVVLGTAMYLSKVQPATNVVCIIGATDNMPSATATKPSDIVVSMSGKTIEVLNTDAEGRLVLADLITYAKTHFKPDLICDVATLTGAVLVALGTVGSGILTPQDNVSEYVLKCAFKVGEPLWRLPLWPELENETKSATADLANIAKPSVKAGTIMGAMFLKEFAGDTPWCHFDIAGTGWDCKATGFPTSGSSAFSMRTLIEIAKKYEM